MQQERRIVMSVTGVGDEYTLIQDDDPGRL